jgi:hypothetical protein
MIYLTFAKSHISLFCPFFSKLSPLLSRKYKEASKIVHLEKFYYREPFFILERFSTDQSEFFLMKSE